VSLASDINSWMRSWILLCLLKRAPQDDPRSGGALALALLLYALASVLQAHISVSWAAAAGMTLLDLVVMAGFSYLVLSLRGFTARLAQTLTALAGAGAVLGLAALPVMQMMLSAQQDERPATLAVLFWVAILVWSVAVPAHIYRHALSVNLAIGVMVTIMQSVLLFILVNTLFFSLKVTH
jgi:hypothetical protein